MSRSRWVVLIVVLGAIFFALQGGEYSTMQWLTLRGRERDEAEQVRLLTREVDSLDRVRKRIESDPGMQERIAREKYGMLRQGELEYTIVRDSQ